MIDTCLDRLASRFQDWLGIRPTRDGLRGLRSKKGSGGRTYDQLYQESRRKNVRGRSKTNKAHLEKAVGRD